jgi:hypothetical protein
LFILSIQYLVKLLFFFHPVVWLAHWAIGEFREHACDDEASDVSGVRQKTCCEGFLTILECAGGRPQAAFGMAGFNTPIGPIQRRLMRMMKRGSGCPHTLNAGYHVLVVLVGLLMLTHVWGRSLPGANQLLSDAPWQAPKVATIALTPGQPQNKAGGNLVTPENGSIEYRAEDGTSKRTRAGIQDYRVVGIDTRKFVEPACLTVDVSVDPSAKGRTGSFDLFPGDVIVPADGAAQERLRAKISEHFAYDVHPGKSKRISVFFDRGNYYQLGATGGWGTKAGLTSPFTVTAHADTNYERLQISRTVCLSPGHSTAAISGELPEEGYVTYLVNATGFTRKDAVIMHVSFADDSVRGRFDVFDSALDLPKDPAFHRSASELAIDSLPDFTLTKGKRIAEQPSLLVIPSFLHGPHFVVAVSRPWLGGEAMNPNFSIRLEVKPAAEGN